MSTRIRSKLGLKFLAAVIGSLFLFSPSSSALASEQPDEIFQGPDYSSNAQGVAGNAFYQIWFTDKVAYDPWGSRAEWPTELLGWSGNEGVQTVTPCTKYPCGVRGLADIKTNFPSCNQEQRLITNCVGEVYAIREDGLRIQAEYIRELNKAIPNRFPDNKKLGLPKSSNAFVVKFPNLEAGQDSEYLITVAVKGPVDSPGLHMNIAKLGYREANYPAQLVFVRNQESHTYKPLSLGGPARWQCIDYETGLCLLPTPLPLGVKFGLQLSTTVNHALWLHSRLSSFTVSQKHSGKNFVLRVEGNPSVVAEETYSTTLSEIPTAFKKMYEFENMETVTNQNFEYTPANSLSFRAHEVFKSRMQNRAVAEPTAWTVRTIGKTDLLDSNYRPECLTKENGIVGVVSTNATVFNFGAPEYNKSTKSLDYKVDGPKLMKNGDLNRGFYRLKIKSSFANCLYRATSQARSTKVSVTNAKGLKQSATVVSGEKSGWWTIDAFNFDFDSPKISVKFK